MQFTLQSGAVLDVTEAAFQDAIALSKALLTSLKGTALTADILSQDVSKFLEPIIAAAISDNVEHCLFRCATRASYEGTRVSPALFDDPKLGNQARADYYEICLKVIEVNCKPFFQQALSAFMGKKASTVTPT